MIKPRWAQPVWASLEKLITYSASVAPSCKNKTIMVIQLSVVLNLAVICKKKKKKKNLKFKK